MLGFPIDLVDYLTVLEQIQRWRSQARREFIIVATAADIQLSRRYGLTWAAQRAGLSLPDGVAIVGACRLLGHRPRGRVTGPELMLRLCDWGRRYGYRHFFYGSTEPVVAELARRLAARFTGLQVVGWYCPPFWQQDQQEDHFIVDRINDCRPDIVWVGLGGTKQILWMAQHVGIVQAPVMIGVGAAFNFHSGAVKWAPRWIRRMCMEWAYRMATEPRKIVPRTRHTLIFCLRAGAQAASARLFGTGSSTDQPDVAIRQTLSR